MNKTAEHDVRGAQMMEHLRTSHPEMNRGKTIFVPSSAFRLDETTPLDPMDAPPIDAMPGVPVHALLERFVIRGHVTPVSGDRTALMAYGRRGSWPDVAYKRPSLA